MYILYLFTFLFCSGCCFFLTVFLIVMNIPPPPPNTIQNIIELLYVHLCTDHATHYCRCSYTEGSNVIPVVFSRQYEGPFQQLCSILVM